MTKTRNSQKARSTCLETHGKQDRVGTYLVCHICGGILRPQLGDKWRADHIRRHAEGGTESADNLWPICLPCDTGEDGKAARDTREVAKGKRISAKHFGLEKKRGFRKAPSGWKFDWSIGRYVRID